MGIKFRVRIPSSLSRFFPEFGGKLRVIKNFENKLDGEKWVADIEQRKATYKADRQHAELGFKRLDDCTFRQAAAGFVARADISQRTRDDYLEKLNHHLLPVFGDCACSTVGRSAIQEYLNSRAAASASSRRRHLIIIRMVLGWARDEGFAVDASAWGFKVPKGTPTVRRQFDPDVMRDFLDQLPKRDRAVLETVALSGLRLKELRAFEVSWIRWKELRIAIPNDIRFVPKDKEPRSIPLSARLRQVLTDWLGDRTAGLVFPPARHGGGKGNSGSGVDVRAILRKHRKDSKGGRRKAIVVPFRGAHDFRHHYLSWLFHIGRPATEVRDIAGHADLTTTNVYSHSAQGFLEETRRAMDEAEVRVGPKVGPGRKKRAGPLAKTGSTIG